MYILLCMFIYQYKWKDSNHKHKEKKNEKYISLEKNIVMCNCKLNRSFKSRRGKHLPKKEKTWIKSHELRNWNASSHILITASVYDIFYLHILVEKSRVIHNDLGYTLKLNSFNRFEQLIFSLISKWIRRWFFKEYKFRICIKCEWILLISAHRESHSKRDQS